jgi:DNA-binding NarL/FixJ family response regulator
MARACLREARELAEALAARPLVVEVARLATSARLRLEERPPATSEESASRRAGLAMGLSSREVDVLALIADGLSDREIAGRLFISERTASHHVSHILTKLALGRRGEAAAVAHRMGLSSLEVEP